MAKNGDLIPGVAGIAYRLGMAIALWPLVFLLCCLDRPFRRDCRTIWGRDIWSAWNLLARA